MIPVSDTRFPGNRSGLMGAMFVMIILLMVFPDIAMWLPRQFY